MVVGSAQVFELDVNKEEFQQLQSFFDGAFDLHFYVEPDKAEGKKSNNELPF